MDNQNYFMPMVPKALTAESEELLACTKELDIQSEEDADTARELLVALKKIHTKIEATRKTQKDPHWKKCKAVDSEFKPSLDALDKASSDVKRRMAQWQQRVKAEQLKAARAAEAAAEAAMPLKKAAGAESMSDCRVADFSTMDIPRPRRPRFCHAHHQKAGGRGRKRHPPRIPGAGLPAHRERYARRKGRSRLPPRETARHRRTIKA